MSYLVEKISTVGHPDRDFIHRQKYSGGRQCNAYRKEKNILHFQLKTPLQNLVFRYIVVWKKDCLFGLPNRPFLAPWSGSQGAVRVIIIVDVLQNFCNGFPIMILFLICPWNETQLCILAQFISTLSLFRISSISNLIHIRIWFAPWI